MPAAAPARARRGGFPHEAVWSTLGALALAAARYLPWDRVSLGACPFRAVTGLPCPSCGGTRAFIAASHLDPAQALWMNPLAALLAAAAAIYIVHALGVWLLGWRRWRPQVRSERRARALRYAVLAALAANWIYLILAGR